MFAQYNYEKIPEIKVTFGKTVQNVNDFQDFIDEWRGIYKMDNEFTFFFDTRNIENIEISYLFSLISFMRDIRMNEKALLTKTEVVINSTFVYNLLNMVFKVYTPFCKVIIRYNDNVLEI